MIVVNARFLTQSITGVQRFAIEIAIRLKKHLGVNVIFVCPKGCIQNDVAQLLNVQIIGNFSSHIWEQVELPRYLRKIKSPLLLNLCNTAPLFYNNKIVTIHDLGFEVYPKTYSKKFLFLYKFLIPRIAKKSKKIITVSEFSKQELIKYYNIDYEKINVVYNAVGDIFVKKINTRLKSENYFLAVSSLNYRKNLNLVLDAFIDFSQKNENYKLYIIGDLDKKNFATLNMSNYDNYDNIIFTGRLKDEELVEYYSNAISFIYPSLYEGFGIPPLEAQKCETPSIVSKESCFKEIFAESAVYCDTFDPKDLSSKMQSMISDNSLRNEIIKLGIINNRNYSWAKSVNKLLGIINIDE